MKKLFIMLLSLSICFTFAACSASSADTGLSGSSSYQDDYQDRDQSEEQQEIQEPEMEEDTDTPSDYDPAAELSYDGYEILEVFQDGQFSFTEYSLDGEMELFLMSMDVMVTPDTDRNLSLMYYGLPDGCEITVEVVCGDNLVYTDSCSTEGYDGTAEFTYFADSQLLQEDLALVRSYVRSADGTILAGVDMISIVDR